MNEKQGILKARAKKTQISIGFFKTLWFFLLCLLPGYGAWIWLSGHDFPWIAAAYCGMSLVTFFLYRNDKKSAQQQQQRIPENTLHLCELLGGWLGALIAQQVYRHKTRKLSYQTVFWLIVIIHQVYWLDTLILDHWLFEQVQGLSSFTASTN